MSEQDKKDCNLIVIAVVENFASKHNMASKDVLALFKQHNILETIRSQYAVLHMLDLDEAEEFAEELLQGKAS